MEKHRILRRYHDEPIAKKALCDQEEVSVKTFEDWVKSDWGRALNRQFDKEDQSLLKMQQKMREAHVRKRTKQSFAIVDRALENLKQKARGLTDTKSVNALSNAVKNLVLVSRMETGETHAEHVSIARAQRGDVSVNVNNNTLIQNDPFNPHKIEAKPLELEGGEEEGEDAQEVDRDGRRIVDAVVVDRSEADGYEEPTIR